MKEVEIQTDVEENTVNAKKDQEDLIRLQSSMTIMQEDHLKERKLLNEKIAELQSEIDLKDKIVEEPTQKEVKSSMHKTQCRVSALVNWGFKDFLKER